MENAERIVEIKNRKNLKKGVKNDKTSLELEKLEEEVKRKKAILIEKVAFRYVMTRKCTIKTFKDFTDDMMINFCDNLYERLYKKFNGYVEIIECLFQLFETTKMMLFSEELVYFLNHDDKLVVKDFRKVLFEGYNDKFKDRNIQFEHYFNLLKMFKLDDKFFTGVKRLIDSNIDIEDKDFFRTNFLHRIINLVCSSEKYSESKYKIIIDVILFLEEKYPKELLDFLYKLVMYKNVIEDLKAFYKKQSKKKKSKIYKKIIIYLVMYSNEYIE